MDRSLATLDVFPARSYKILSKNTPFKQITVQAYYSNFTVYIVWLRLGKIETDLYYDDIEHPRILGLSRKRSVV